MGTYNDMIVHFDNEVKKGLFPIPLIEGSKQPTIGGWGRESENDFTIEKVYDELKRLRTQNKRFDIGILAGKSNVICLDCDSVENSRKVMKYYGSFENMPPFEVSSSNKIHVFYRNDGSLEKRDFIKVNNMELDIKAWGVVKISPSLHKNGKHYVCRKPIESVKNLPCPPTWLKEMYEKELAKKKDIFYNSNVKFEGEYFDVRHLHGQISLECYNCIVNGIADKLDRSMCVIRCLNSLVRCNLTRSQVLGIMTDKNNQISLYVAYKGIDWIKSEIDRTFTFIENRSRKFNN